MLEHCSVEEEVVDVFQLVQWNLIKARVLAQEAVILEELFEQTEVTPLRRYEVRNMRRKAHKHKTDAKDQLVHLEIWNGRQFLNGEDWFPMKEFLNGRDFRNWRCYKNVYSCSQLFQGVDPH